MMIPSTDVIQLTLTLKITTAQVVETSVTRTIILSLLMNNKLDTISHSSFFILIAMSILCLLFFVFVLFS